MLQLLAWFLVLMFLGLVLEVYFVWSLHELLMVGFQLVVDLWVSEHYFVLVWVGVRFLWFTSCDWCIVVDVCVNLLDLLLLAL